MATAPHEDIRINVEVYKGANLLGRFGISPDETILGVGEDLLMGGTLHTIKSRVFTFRADLHHLSGICISNVVYQVR